MARQNRPRRRGRPGPTGWKRRLTCLVTALLAVLALGLGWGMGAGLAGSAARPSGGTWKVGLDPTYPPFEMRQEASGELIGFDVELLRAIGRDAGREIRFVAMPFDGLIPALQAGSIDAVISSMTITPERARAVDFSRPYFAAGLAIVVKEGDTTIRSLKDLEGRTIAVQVGTTGALEAQKVTGARVVQFDAAPLALQELANGNVDAVVNDLPSSLYAIHDAGLKGVRIAGEPITREHYGIALSKGSPIRAEVDRALTRLLADGDYEHLYRRWFAKAPPTLPVLAPALGGNGATTSAGAAGDPDSRLQPGRLLRNLLQGAGVTVMLTLLSFAFGLVGGALVALARRSPWRLLRALGRIYVDFFRGTPLLVQLFMVYFGLPALFQGLGLAFSLDRFVAAVLALSLNLAAYLAEILRGGIASIERGQWEAADALAMNPMQRMRFVVFPQALRRVLSPLGNEFITLIKDTSLAAVIGFDELFRQGQLTVATTYRAFEVYGAVALVYLVMTTAASLLFRWLERRLEPGRV
jgi:arginine/lysine/histidine/glutamine transport system substrate-binding/permease protein